MHRRIRRALSLLFALTFLIAAPALIISTAGYRYNFLKGRIERTGVVFVSSKPSGAHVLIGGNDTEKTTPSRVRRLLPGTYAVGLEKDGYHSWTKTVDVRSRETTFLNNIALFLDVAPEPLLDVPVDQAIFSPDRSRAAALSVTESSVEVRVVDLRSGEMSLPYRTENVTGAELRVVWSPDSSRFFLERTNGPRSLYFLWEEDSPNEMMDLIRIAPAVYDQAFWSPEGRFLYAAAGGELYAIDVGDRTAVRSGPATEDMHVIGSTFFGIFRDAEGTRLVRRGIRDEAYDILGMIPNGSYRHLDGYAGRLALLDEDRSRLLVIDPGVEPNQLTWHELNATEARWSEDGVLLYRNAFELHTFNPDGAIDSLITRLGGQLTAAEWIPDFGLVLMSDGQEAIITEASSVPDRSITNIASFDAITDIAVHPDGERAWIVGSLDGRQDLWTLELR